jgi:GGDEF domain-containing protein
MGNKDLTVRIAGWGFLRLPFEDRRFRRADAQATRALALIAEARRRRDPDSRTDSPVSVEYPAGSKGRSALSTILDLEASHALSSGQEITFALFAVHPLNETSGRYSEEALRGQVLSVLENFTRNSDQLLPSDPQRISAIFRGTGRTGGATIVREMLNLIQRTPFDISDEKEGVTISASAGLAVCPTDGATSHELVRIAEEALDRAREAGPGSIVIGRSTSPEVEVPPTRNRPAAGE